jgi:hypothetical protein
MGVCHSAFEKTGLVLIREMNGASAYLQLSIDCSFACLLPWPAAYTRGYESPCLYWHSQLSCRDCCY